MATTENYRTPTMRDPEMPDVSVRDTLDYYVTLPNGYDARKEYPLVFCITGYGDLADGEYQAAKLRPYIADKYKVITVGVRYHNDQRDGSNITIHYERVCEHYGIDGSCFRNKNNAMTLLDDLFNLLVARNISSIDPRLALALTPYHQYSSFGFLPALDHLQVLALVLKQFSIDKSRIIAFGSSYGGYIASLLAKYAPGTFAAVIDNSGFSQVSMQEAVGDLNGNISGSYARVINQRRYEILIGKSTLWSVDPLSPQYFSDAHKAIRDLTIAEHRLPSDTAHICYHSMEDTVAPIAGKDLMYKTLRDNNPVFYQRITAKDIDGKLFKNTQHGMEASLRTLFDVSWKKLKKLMVKQKKEIDFDTAAVYKFFCGNQTYRFNYSPQGVTVDIEKCPMKVEKK